MNELIERLKSNEKPFGLLSKEEQECFNEIGMKNCEIYRYSKWNQAVHNIFHTDSTYRIKPDYQPEPEYDDLEIKEYEFIYYPRKMLGIDLGNGESYILSKVPSMPNFECFLGEDNKVIHCIANISYYINEGNKVIARLRREVK